MKYFLELNSLFKGDECYQATDSLFLMYCRFFHLKSIKSNLIFNHYENIGVSRMILYVESDLDLTRENGKHSYSSMSSLTTSDKRFTSWIQVDCFPEISNPDSSLYKVETMNGRGGQQAGVDCGVKVSNLHESITLYSERSQKKNKDLGISYLWSKKDFVPHTEIVRRYVLQPVAWAHDYRQKIETREVAEILNGNLDIFYANEC